MTLKTKKVIFFLIVLEILRVIVFANVFMEIRNKTFDLTFFKLIKFFAVSITTISCDFLYLEFKVFFKMIDSTHHHFTFNFCSCCDVSANHNAALAINRIVNFNNELLGLSNFTSQS